MFKQSSVFIEFLRSIHVSFILKRTDCVLPIIRLFAIIGSFVRCCTYKSVIFLKCACASKTLTLYAFFYV